MEQQIRMEALHMAESFGARMDVHGVDEIIRTAQRFANFVLTGAIDEPLSPVVVGHGGIKESIFIDNAGNVTWHNDLPPPQKAPA